MRVRLPPSGLLDVDRGELLFTTSPLIDIAVFTLDVSSTCGSLLDHANDEMRELRAPNPSGAARSASCVRAYYYAAASVMFCAYQCTGFGFFDVGGERRPRIHDSRSGCTKR